MVDLSGSARAPRRFIDWPTLFDFNDDNVKHNEKIDIPLSTPLFTLPPTVVAHPNPSDNHQSLAQRNLLRALTFSLPSGQRVAKAMQIPPLTDDDFDMLKPMIESEPASVFEDREISGDWRVEKFDEDGGCEVRVFTGADARQQAIDYTKQRYGPYVEKRLEPYRRGR